jgi:hypothetical protein
VPAVLLLWRALPPKSTYLASGSGKQKISHCLMDAAVFSMQTNAGAGVAFRNIQQQRRQRSHRTHACEYIASQVYMM